ncbi:MAG TPA: carbonic anhydrase [Longimicrobium sp.]|nr:carbonic anhydrase [Longimicrobium sp.]
MLRLSALSGAAALGAGLALPEPADAAWEQEPIDTPDKALDALKKGNERFVERGMTTPQRRLVCPADGRPPTQTPFAAILSCADSRVPVELLFDEGFGRLFVCRSAGNITTSELIGSLEYGVAVLGALVVVVLGHNDCGAVKETMAATPAPGQITSIYSRIYPAVARSDGNLALAIEENVKEQVMLLRRASTVIRQREPRSVRVVGATYDLCGGAVRWLQP